MSELFVIGGTGTLGEAFILKAVTHKRHVMCFSRDELKQKLLRDKIGSNFLKCTIGDIRDKDAMNKAMRGSGTVLNFSALKHIDTVEQFPEEGVKTNLLGNINALNCAMENHIERFIFSSTDKAVEPINAYGFSKALAEKTMMAHPGKFKKVVFRWGNVGGSRGSVIPIFVEKLKAGLPVQITDMEMTRFWIHIQDAVNFLWRNMENPTGLYIPPIKAAKVIDVVNAIGSILSVTPAIEIVGIRPGEKIHEKLEVGGASSNDPSYQFTDDELRAFLRPLVLGV